MRNDLSGLLAPSTCLASNDPAHAFGFETLLLRQRVYSPYTAIIDLVRNAENPEVLLEAVSCNRSNVFPVFVDDPDRVQAIVRTVVTDTEELPDLIRNQLQVPEQDGMLQLQQREGRQEIFRFRLSPDGQARTMVAKKIAFVCNRFRCEILCSCFLSVVPK
jgi:hypothetical protein